MSRQREGSSELQVRQKEQLEQFYSQLDQQKEHQLRVDQVEAIMSQVFISNGNVVSLRRSRGNTTTHFYQTKSPQSL